MNIRGSVGLGDRFARPLPAKAKPSTPRYAPRIPHALGWCFRMQRNPARCRDITVLDNTRLGYQRVRELMQVVLSAVAHLPVQPGDFLLPTLLPHAAATRFSKLLLSILPTELALQDGEASENRLIKRIPSTSSTHWFHTKRSQPIQRVMTSICAFVARA